ncbi:hypothetical protein ACHAXN_007816 [Cyclotella atomus]
MMPKSILRKLLTATSTTHLPYLHTTIHLRSEIALLLCNILFICASSHNLYRNAYLQSAGDWKYLAASSLWLGRHVFLRIICTASWIDVGSDCIGERSVVDGLGWGRRRDFHTWMEQHTSSRQSRRGNSQSFVKIVCSWIRWMMDILSPWNLVSNLVYFIKQYCMGGQYCDGSAARGVASAAILMYGTGGGSFGGVEDQYHTSSKTSKHGHHGGQHSVVFNETTEMHTTGILFLARVWGTSCALSSALWSLIQTGETMGHMGGTIWGWIKSCLTVGMPGSSSSEQQQHSSGQSGGGGKKNRKKQQNQGFIDPRGSNSASHIASDDSLDCVNGKLQMIFQIFPNNIRSKALHTQQMRTSEMFIALQKTWEAFPPAQMQIAILTFLILLFGWLFYVDDGYYYRLFVKNPEDTQVNNESVMPNFGFHRNNAFFDEQYTVGGPLSAYWSGLTQPVIPDIFTVGPPSFLNLIFRIVSFGTAASLLLYGRVLLPIPEFVAGTNVLKAVRAEARSLGAGATTRHNIKQNKDLPWVERYKSITAENRLRLYYKVGIVRIIENVLLCAILPQTEVVCRTTGHCESGPLLWGASGVTGISGSRYIRGSFDALMKDPFTTRASILVVAFLTAFLLLAQMTVMNRTYMAIMGYICGEWRLVREDAGNEKNSFFGKYAAPPIRRVSNSTIMQWDPKRRYQKGDLIAFDYCVYEAMSNSPEGPPFDTYLRAAHDLFNEELGHRSTSPLLTNTSMGCWILASILCGTMFFWKNAGWNFIPLMLMSLACAVAGSVIAHLSENASSVIINMIVEIEQSQ